jgi:hypothetical protein
MFPRSIFLLVFLAIEAASVRAQVQPTPSRVCEPQGSSAAQDGTLDLPALPKTPVSLIGGTVSRIDPVRDKVTLRAFGGRDVVINFDVRTCVMRGDAVASMRDVKPGTRLYADTILNDGHVFARSIKISTNAAVGEIQGQVLGYDASKRTLRIRDAISAHGFSVLVTANTDIRSGTTPMQASELVEGALVKAVFRPVDNGNGLAEKIEIFAKPGGTFTFAGKILSVDLRNGYVTLVEPDSQNTFDVGLDGLSSEARSRLKEGAEVTVRARFDGSKYQAESIEPATDQQP